MREELERFMVDPRDAGIDEDKLAALVARARQEVDEGLLPAAQVALAKGWQAGLLRNIW